MSDLSHGPLSAFAGLPVTAGTGGGVRATERLGLGIAHLTARIGQAAAIERLVHAQFGLILPHGPRRSCVHEVAAVGIGPETWLMTCEYAGNAFAAGLRDALAQQAAVLDLSDAYVLLRLAGPRLRQALAKLVPIDLHPRSFAVGAVAQTVAEHMAVMLWRLPEGGSDEPVFELGVGRSFAHSLYRALREACAEFGFVLEPA